MPKQTTQMATHPQQKLHFLLIPLMCQGHLIPMVDMARLLAKRQVMVTIATTPLNAARFDSIVDRDVKSGLPIHVLRLQFPHAEVGLPEGCESIDTLPSPSHIKNFMCGLRLLQKPLEKLLEEGLNPFPSCIISDKFVVWTGETCGKFGIPRILFDGMSCFVLLCRHNLHMTKVYERVSHSEAFLIPGLPDPIEITKAQLPGDFNPGSDLWLNDMREKVRQAEEGAFGVVVNSFEELESEYVKEYKNTTGKKVWCVGPVSVCNDDDLDKAQRGNQKASNDEAEYVLKWLDMWGPRTVVYACLGSLNRLTPPQLVELGLGLEESKRPFIWVIRGAYKKEEFENWLKEDGFEERIKGQGLLIRGWAPQVLILSHPSIGAFLTHCGWNSTLEGICAGVPLITWPLFAEQFCNEKFIVQVSKTGVSVGTKMVVHLGEEEKFGVSVKRDQVKEAISAVMDEGKQGEVMREKVKNLAEAAKKAIEQGGSSNENVTCLLEDVMQHNL